MRRFSQPPPGDPSGLARQASGVKARPCSVVCSALMVTMVPSWLGFTASRSMPMDG